MVALNDGANHRSCDESMRGPCVTIWRCTLAAKRFRNAALCVPATCTACSSRSNSLPGQFSRMHSRADAASAMPEAEGIKCTLMLPSTGFLHNWIGDAAHTCSVSIVVRLKPRQLCPEPPPRHPGLLPRPQMGIFPLKDPSSGYVDSEAPCQKKSNVEKHVYVLGINAYDHDDSACLLRDGEIAYAIAKERITRKKHDTGFYQKVVDYCLAAEGISLDDVDLVVRNCYVLPVEDLEIRMVSQDVPEVMDDAERLQAAKHPLYLSRSNKVVTVSHHLAHAYSAFAACPFDEGVVMVVDGVGTYSSDITEPGQLTDSVDPLARESESYYKFEGSRLETLRKVWLKPVPGFLSDEFYYMPGLGALYSRVSSYIFADWDKCGEVMGLAPYGRSGAIKPLLDMKNGELSVPEWGVEFDKPWLVEREPSWEASSSMRHWEDLAWRVQHDAENVLLERAIWLRRTT